MRSTASFLVPVLLLAALAGCSTDAAPPDPGAEEPRFGGAAVVAGIADLQTMNALASNETYALMFQREVLFTPLLRYGPGLEPAPWLAESWDTVRVAPDTLQLTLRLRDDVRWHDGAPTTAEDVAFTYRRATDPAVGSALAAGFAQYYPGVEVPDARTVRVRLRPHAEFLDGWTRLPVLPRHLLGRVATDRLASHPFGTERPVGNGPFRFVRRVPGQEWVFEANPDFPAELGGRPYLDRLVYRVVPDPTALTSGLLTGTVDVALGIGAAQVEQLQEQEGVELRSAPAPQWVFLAWNTRLPLFDTPAERRALTMALDRQTMISGLLGSRARVGRTPVTPAHWAFDASDSRTAVPHDPEAARRLLAGEGWRDRDGDGVLEDARGRPFRFALKIMQGNDTHRDIAQVAQAQLRAIGVDVRPTSVEPNTLIGQLQGSRNGSGERERDFQAVVMGWADDFRKDDSGFFHSRHRDGPFQISGFSHARVDALLDALQVVPDRRAAQPLWAEYQALMAHEVPHTVLYYPDRVAAVSERLRGVDVDARGELASVGRWWVAGEGRPAATGGSSGRP